MKFKFNCYGHENILSTHRNTLEFTKDDFLTKTGDCIIGINADFDYNALVNFVKDYNGRIIDAKIYVGSFTDNFSFQLNQDFSDEREIVIRKSEFKSERTLGNCATKAAIDINRELVSRLKDKKSKLEVQFTPR